MIVSIFNDVIGPVMRGPSSSHCAAALRIGRIALDLMDGQIEEVLVEFDRNGSLPTTHESQGSDMGLFGGLLGWEASDELLPNSADAIRKCGISVRIETIVAGDPHPNTYRLTLSNSCESHFLKAVSTGGGIIEVIDIDGFEISLHGDYYETLIYIKSGAADLRNRIEASWTPDSLILHQSEKGQMLQVKAQCFVPEALLEGLAEINFVKRIGPVLPVTSHSGIEVPFTSCNSLLDFDAGRNIPLWKHAATYESARSGLSEDRVLEMMVELVRILRRSIAQGLEGTSYEDRILGFQSGGFQQMMNEGKLLNGGAMNRIILYVTALMEVKSSMGVIIAMPTAGACSALPGATIAMAEEMGLDELEMAKAILASGLIGVFITTAWTFAAEAGGCQAECGAASSMAAAALATLAGPTLAQSLAAASMALQNVIGLVCDPIANRVEAPCLGKNVLAASNALSCANMALAGFDPLIPLDEVIETAKRVGNQMPRELRCTALGGLSVTPTSKLIEGNLTRRQRS